MPLNVRPPTPGEPPGVKKLGRYECTEPLGGDGGFETYRGRVKGLTGLDRSFAVKVLRLKRSESASAIVEPFIQAAKRSAAIANPRIATVVDTGAGDGVVFAVTPFMEGLDLSHFLAAARQIGLLAMGKDDRARQWYPLVAYVGAEIARGLHAAHTQAPPLIHGALCPGNVLITSRGAVRLLDFGLRAAVRRPFEPRPRRLLPYIAPELAAPAADGTIAGDMYSLGVLLGELASGDSPPQGRRASETQGLLSKLPEDLGSLIGRLVSVGPAARPSAEESASLLTACYAGSSEANLVSSLSSLVQDMVGRQEPSQAPAEAKPGLDRAREEVDAASPPPAEVEHDESFEMSPPDRASEVAVPPPAEVADLSVPDPEAVESEVPMPVDGASFESSIAEAFTADPSIVASGPLGASRPATLPEERFASEPTTIGDQSLIDDLLKKSRTTQPLSPPIASRPAANHLASQTEAPASAPLPRGPTQPGFSPTGTAVFESPPPASAAAPESTGFSAEWSAAVVETPDKADSMPTFLPDPDPEPPALLENRQPDSPSFVGFETPPATWGARALAALGGQAGLAPAHEPSGLGLLDQGLLDQVRAEPGSMPLPGSPRLQVPDDEVLNGPPNLSMDEPPIDRQQAPVELNLADSAPTSVPSLLDAQPQGDSLLEDQLIDAPEGMPMASPWTESEADEQGMPVPGSLPFREPRSAEVAQVVASVVDPPSVPEAQAFLEEDGSPPAPAAPAYFDDSGAPLDESILAAPATGHAPTLIAFAPPPVPAKQAASASQGPPPVPSWARSPEAMPKRTSRALIGGIALAVLAVSVALGGLAGFMVGTRGKSTTSDPGAMRAPMASNPLAATQEQPGDDPSAEAKLVPTKRKVAQPSTPTVGGKAAEAKKGAEKLPAAKTATAAPAAMREPSDKTLPVNKAPRTLPAAALGKGMGDAPGSGELVNVSVSSQPEGATVWINGKERGLTPLQVKIQSGPARVVIILAGYGLAAADITASEGAKISKPLMAIDPPLVGEARFRAECTTQGKLPIMIDGKETGMLCPFSKLRVDPGVHKIGLFVPALGVVHEKEVTLRPGVRSIVFAD